MDYHNDYTWDEDDLCVHVACSRKPTLINGKSVEYNYFSLITTWISCSQFPVSNNSLKSQKLVNIKYVIKFSTKCLIRAIEYALPFHKRENTKVFWGLLFYIHDIYSSCSYIYNIGSSITLLIWLKAFVVNSRRYKPWNNQAIIHIITGHCWQCPESQLWVNRPSLSLCITKACWCLQHLSDRLVSRKRLDSSTAGVLRRSQWNQIFISESAREVAEKIISC